MEFLINCESEKKKLTIRTTALKQFCSCMWIDCEPAREPNQRICIVDDSDSYVACLKINALIAFCALHCYVLAVLPETSFEEFLQHIKK